MRGVILSLCFISYKLYIYDLAGIKKSIIHRHEYAPLFGIVLPEELVTISKLAERKGTVINNAEVKKRSCVF